MRLRGANGCDQVEYSCGRTMKIVEYEWVSSLVRFIFFIINIFSRNLQQFVLFPQSPTEIIIFRFCEGDG